MFPPSEELARHPKATVEQGLEERLRGESLYLITSSSESMISKATTLTSPGLILNNAAAIEPKLPPHMAGASLGDQQAYLAAAIRHNDQPHAVANVPEPQTNKKRLNQAQRRQMNAQLSIPVEPRQVPSQNSNTHYTGNPK